MLVTPAGIVTSPRTEQYSNIFSVILVIFLDNFTFLRLEHAENI